MTDAVRDQNHVTSALGVSSVDNVTTLPFKVDPSTGRLLVDMSGGGGGTVETISIATANGFAGTSDGDPADPVLTIETTVTAPVLAGNGTAIEAATTTGSGSTVVLNTAPVLASTVTIGTPAGTTGAILLRGTTSGTVTLSVADAAGTWTMKLPTTGGTNGYFLQTDGSGNTTWASASGGGVSFGSSTEIPYTNATTDDFDYSSSFTFDGSTLVVPAGGLEVGSGNTVTLGGAFTTSGAFTTTLTVTANTSVTLPTSGTLMANPMTTGGDVIYGGASGAPTRLTNGTAGQVLTSAGTTLAPTWATPSTNSTTITVANEATDTTCFPIFVTAATGDLAPKSNTGLTFNSSTSLLTATLLAGTTSVTSATIRASSNDSGSLGASGTAFSDLFLASGGVINFAAGNYTLTHSTGVLTANLDFRVTTAGTNSASVATLAGTQTFTNKRIQPRSSSAASGDITPALATANVWRRTALSAGITINAPTGTPVLGEVLVFMLIDNGTSRALTWNGAFIPMGQALPTATTISKELLVTASYNGAEWETVWAQEQ